MPPEAGPGEGRRLEVLVVGGGVVGLTSALLFARAGFRTGLVDARERHGDSLPQDTEYDLRVLALTHASVRIFEELGVWPQVVARRHGRYEGMEVWDDRSRGRVSFSAAACGLPCLGYIVEVAMLEAALESQLAAAGVQEWRPVRLRDLSLRAEHVRVHLEGETLDAALVVGADGAASPVREFAALGWSEADYGERAVVATLETDWPHEGVARQVFLDTGPLALLPLDHPRRVSLVWTQPEALALERVALEACDFAPLVTQASGGVLGGLTPLGPRAAQALRRGHAAQYVAHRVALVGDAAHTIHPLAGQGANLGFMDAAALCEVAEAARARGRDPGSRSVLRRYARWRRGENEAMQQAMDGFRWLFNGSEAWRRALRSVGMQAFDRLAPVKRAVIERASGVSGDLPARARANQPPASGG
jgi:2-polyprenylphenol 6-hydroxylase